MTPRFNIVKCVDIKVPIYNEHHREACVDWGVEATWQAAVRYLIQIYYSYPYSCHIPKCFLWYETNAYGNLLWKYYVLWSVKSSFSKPILWLFIFEIYIIELLTHGHVPHFTLLHHFIWNSHQSKPDVGQWSRVHMMETMLYLWVKNVVDNDNEIILAWVVLGLSAPICVCNWI